MRYFVVHQPVIVAVALFVVWRHRDRGEEVAYRRRV
jgi:hypothetical protein